MELCIDSADVQQQERATACLALQGLQPREKPYPYTLDPVQMLQQSGRARAQVNSNEVLQGLVMPAASYALLGKGGAVLVIVICFMAVTSSGASEMVAVSSLFTFDIYRKYINPKVCMLCPPPHPRVGSKALVISVCFLLTVASSDRSNMVRLSPLSRAGRVRVPNGREWITARTAP